MKRQQKKIRTGGSLSLEEREAMIKEYLTGQYLKNELWKKYAGQDKGHGQLLEWMRKVGYISDDRKPSPVHSFFQPVC
jgi:hypothetical protein